MTVPADDPPGARVHEQEELGVGELPAVVEEEFRAFARSLSDLESDVLPEERLADFDAGVGGQSLGHAVVGTAVRMGRNRRGDELPAAGEVLEEEPDRRVLQVFGPGRDDDQVVGPLPEHERALLDPAFFPERVLAPEVVFDLGGFEKVDEILEHPAEVCDLLRLPARGVVHPGRRRRLEDEDPVVLLARATWPRTSGRSSRARMPVVVPPRLVIGERPAGDRASGRP